MGPKQKLLRIVLIGCDAMFALVAIYLAIVTRVGIEGFSVFSKYTGGMLAAVGTTLLTAYIFGLYEPEARPRRVATILRVVGSVVASMAILSVISYWTPWWKLWRSMQLYYACYASALLVFWRLTMWTRIVEAIPVINALVIADSHDLALAKELEQNPIVRFRIARELAPDLSTQNEINLLEQCNASAATAILVGTHDISKDVQDLIACKAQGAEVFDLCSVYKQAIGRVPVRHVTPQWIALGPNFSLRRNRLYQNYHRAFDIVTGLVLYIITLPIQLLAALAIWLESGGPILYEQVRVGLDGSHFTIKKFRTMIQDAEKSGAQWSQPKDPRITRVGRLLRRTRIDELPQLFNVLRGDMSLIGPRPERPEFVDKLAESIPFYGLRHTVRPGLTGWAQVNHGYGSTVEDALKKFEYDLYYIQESSILLDGIIALRTVHTVLFKRGS